MYNFWNGNKIFNTEDYIKFKLVFPQIFESGFSKTIKNFQNKLLELLKEKDYQLQLNKFESLLFLNENQIIIKLNLFNLIFSKYSKIEEKIKGNKKFDTIEFKLLLIKIKEFLLECNYVYNSIYKTQKISIDSNVDINQTYKLITSCKYLTDIIKKLNEFSNYNKQKNTSLILLINDEKKIQLKSDNQRLSFLRCLHFNHTFDIKQYKFTKNNTDELIFVQWTSFWPNSKIQLFNKRDNSILELLFIWSDLVKFLKYKLIQLFEWFNSFYNEINI